MSNEPQPQDQHNVWRALSTTNTRLENLTALLHHWQRDYHTDLSTLAKTVDEATTTRNYLVAQLAALAEIMAAYTEDARPQTPRHARTARLLDQFSSNLRASTPAAPTPPEPHHAA